MRSSFRSACKLILLICVSFIFSCDLTKPNKVADPVFLPPAGNYLQSQQVAISCATEGAEIRYTLDGSTPLASSTLYTGPFEVGLGTTVKAIATKRKHDDSKVTTAFYSGIVPTPEFVTPSGSFLAGTILRIRINGALYQDGDIDGLAVRYTLDGTEPTDSSAVYVDGIELTQSCIIKARAYRYNWNPSSIASAQYYVFHELSITGSCNTPGAAYGVCVAGNYAYVADMDSGLQVIDISNSAHPVIVGSCDLPGEAWGIALAGNYAYLADMESGLQVIDISNPSSPVLVGSCGTSDQARGIAVAGNYAYVGDCSSGLQVIDISNPSSPVIVGSWDTPGDACGLAVAGDYAYVGDSSSGLQVIDISDPAHPELIGSSDTFGSARGVALAGDYAYVVDGNDLVVIDISDPAHPFNVSYTVVPDLAQGVVVMADRAYVAELYCGMRVFDISSPSHPGLVGACVTPGPTWGLAVTGDYVYLADGSSGLQVIAIEQKAEIRLAK